MLREMCFMVWLLVSIDRSTQLLFGVLVAVCLMTVFYLLIRFALRGFKFSDRDMKAAGLNHKRRRQLKGRLKRKSVQKKIRF